MYWALDFLRPDLLKIFAIHQFILDQNLHLDLRNSIRAPSFQKKRIFTVHLLALFSALLLLAELF